MTTSTKTECSIVITELDGNMSIRLDIPADSEEAVATALAKALFDQAECFTELALAALDLPTQQ